MPHQSDTGSIGKILEEIFPHGLKEKIFESQNSQIYRIHNPNNGKPQILKVLNTLHPGEERLGKFKREFRILQNLHLDGVVGCGDFYQKDNVYFFSMEDFGGVSLDRIISTRKLQWDEFYKIAIRISRILGSIHEKNIIHKDINPSNLVWNEKTDVLKLIDFGISSEIPVEKPENVSVNMLEGTLCYISPEQTARINKPMDYRSDYYSLGVTLYELLTGIVPFCSSEKFEIIHNHIAKMPVSPSNIHPEIPEVLSGIVMKLLSKMAEDRYQSSSGLTADLEQCYHDTVHSGKVKYFTIGKSDYSGKFQIPNRLYGREDDIAGLLDSFEKTANGENIVSLVKGYSGIGKSALINELNRPIAERQGFFIHGKFDQYKRNMPLFAFIQAFRGLIRQILTEDDYIILKWKTRIQNALGQNGGIITDVLPELEMIIGPQPAAQEVPPEEAANRFHYTVGKFIQVFAREKHPLVVFLDDLQWADPSSMTILRRFSEEKNLQYVYLIAALRDNEIDENHPVTYWIKDIQKVGTLLHEICLTPLSFENANRMISDSLLADTIKTEELTRFCIQKSGGNPFFLRQVLFSLSENGLLYPDASACKWNWDMKKIQALDISEDVMELMKQKIAGLDSEIGDFLKTASCIGVRFDLKTLAIAAGVAPEEASRLLWKPMQEGLIQPTDNGYKYVQEIETNPGYRFIHDRVQQAAYSLMEDNEKLEMRFKIGRLMLEKLTEIELEDRLFEVTNYFQNAAGWFEDESIRVTIAGLNARAGERAKLSSAFEAALGYAETGIALLPENCWETNYKLTYHLHKLRAEANFAIGNFEISIQHIRLMLDRITDPVDRAQLQIILVMHYHGRAEANLSLFTGLEALESFGVMVAKDNIQEMFAREFMHTKEIIQRYDEDQIVYYREGTEEKHKLISKIFASILSSAFQYDPLFAFLLARQFIELSFENGFTSDVTIGFIGLSAFWSAADEDYDFSNQLAVIALKICDRFQNYQNKSEICVAYAAHSNYKLAYEKLIAMLEAGIIIGIENGDNHYAAYNFVHVHVAMFVHGRNLQKIFNKKAPAVLKNIENIRNLKNTLAGVKMCIANLEGNTTDEMSFDIAEMTENELVNEYSHVPFFYQYYINKAIVFFIYEKYQEAQAFILQSIPKLGKIVSSSYQEYIFLHSLCLTQLYSEMTEPEQRDFLEQIQQNQNHLNVCVSACPENNLHKYLLVEAELARIQGKTDDAVILYDRSIRSAKEQGFLHHEAIANELTAKFWLSKNKPEFAEIYLIRAYHVYKEWGALRKLRFMEEKYPHIFAIRSREIAPTTITAMSSTSDEMYVDRLDMETIMRVAGIISSELNFEDSIKKIMKVMMENTGAQRGFLLLKKDTTLHFVARGDILKEEIELLPNIPLSAVAYEQKPVLAVSIVNYVSRLKEHVVYPLSENTGLFEKDAYIQKHQPKSILCKPVLNRGELVGIMYFENNLITGAFSEERLPVYAMLLSQIGIAVENSLLFTDMESKVRERTAELQKLLNMKNELFYMLNHDIKNLFSSIIGAAAFLRAEALSDRAAGFIDMIDTNARIILSLTNDFLNMMVYDSKDMISNKTTIELSLLLKHSCHSFRESIEMSGIQLKFDNLAQIELNVDSDKLLMSFNNLLGNAAKFTPSGGTIEVSSFLFDDAVEIHFRDTGVGIAPEKLKRIFEPLKKAHISGVRGEKGTGLGLAIVKKVVELHEGTVSVTSEVNQGTDFCIRLPVK